MPFRMCATKRFMTCPRDQSREGLDTTFARPLHEIVIDWTKLRLTGRDTKGCCSAGLGTRLRYRWDILLTG